MTNADKEVKSPHWSLTDCKNSDHKNCTDVFNPKHLTQIRHLIASGIALSYNVVHFTRLTSLSSKKRNDSIKH